MLGSYKFFGEFGYLHQVILAYTERFVKKFPEKKGTIKLITYDGNDYCFNSLFPEYFSFVLLPLENGRAGFRSDLDFIFSGIPPISSMFDEPFPTHLHELPFTGDLTNYYITSPIPSPNLPEMDLRCKEYKKIVVAFYRNRNHENWRNFDTTDASWNIQLEQEANDTDTLFCIFTASLECSIPSYIDIKRKNIHLISTLQEASYWFHKCDVAYMNDSGLCDFAKNCAIKKIVIIPATNKVLTSSAVYYKPFPTVVEIFGDYNSLS